jgi:hypothetical protein
VSAEAVREIDGHGSPSGKRTYCSFVADEPRRAVVDRADEQELDGRHDRNAGADHDRRPDGLREREEHAALLSGRSEGESAGRRTIRVLGASTSFGPAHDLRAARARDELALLKQLRGAEDDPPVPLHDVPLRS